MRIQKYQSPANGIVQQDNTYVAKPIEQRLIKRTYQPKQTYLSQDNRTQLQHKQAQKKADEAYNQQIKDKNTAVALNHLIGFSNFADIVGLGIGAGQLAKFGVKQGVKSAANKIQKDLIYGSKINGNMPKLTQLEFEEANRIGYNNAIQILANPTVMETAGRNAALSKRLNLDPLKYEIDGELKEIWNSSEDGLLKMSEIYPTTKVVRADLGRSSLKGRFLRHHGPEDIIEYDNSIDNLNDAISTATHENLHKGSYGESLLQMLKANKLLDINRAKSIQSNVPDYLQVPGELATNLNDVRTALNLNFGQKYPGWNKVRDMVNSFSNSNHPKSFILKSLKQDTQRDYKRIWDALTGRYFMIPLGISFLNYQNYDDSRNNTQ